MVSWPYRAGFGADSGEKRCGSDGGGGGDPQLEVTVSSEDLQWKTKTNEGFV